MTRAELSEANGLLQTLDQLMSNRERLHLAKADPQRECVVIVDVPKGQTSGYTQTLPIPEEWRRKIFAQWQAEMDAKIAATKRRLAQLNVQWERR